VAGVTGNGRGGSQSGGEVADGGLGRESVASLQIVHDSWSASDEKSTILAGEISDNERELNTPMTPTSTRDSGFLSDVKQLMDCNHRVLVVVRYVYAAGSKDFILLESMEQFSELLTRLKERDSVIVFKSINVVNEGTVDRNFIEDSILKYPQGASWVLIGPDNYDYTADWAYAESKSELAEELEDRIGNVVCIINEPEYMSEEFTVAAYVPDLDGNVRPGAY
jgi:hypothetical protein